MLSRELGTHLTGRYIQAEIYPFSFKEYLQMREVALTDKTLYTTAGRALIKNYLEYIQQTYLIFQLFRYETSVKKQMASPKKIYFVDNAIINRIGFNATENRGVFLENMVFVELKRRGLDVFYYSGKKECDFIVRQGVNITDAYQVTWSMSDDKTREREIAGLREAMRAYSLSKGHIITFEGKETISFEDGAVVEVIPAWEWLYKGPDF